MKKDGIKIFKCLVDKSRLSIINNLRVRPMYVELLAKRLGLAPSTVSFHLKKLEDAQIVYSTKEQYYVVYHLNTDILSMSIIDLVCIEDIDGAIQKEREDKYRNSVINNFFEYGKLRSIPVQQRKRKIVLEEIAKCFEKDRNYTEREVNIIIADFNDDFCTIRREMIGFKILERDNGIYKLVSE